MKKNKPDEKQIQQAVLEAFEAKRALLQKEADAHPLSPDFEARLFARVRQTLHTSQIPRRRTSVRLVVVVAILLLTMLFCGTAVACPSLLDRVVRFFTKEDTQRGNTHYIAVVEGAERRAFDISTYYTLSGVPEDFVSIVSREGPTDVSRLWGKLDSPSGQSYITFDQHPLYALCVLSTEGHTAETVLVNGYEATRYTAPNSQKIIWCTEDCMFILGFWGPDTQGLDALALADTITQIKSQSTPLR